MKTNVLYHILFVLIFCNFLMVANKNTNSALLQSDIIAENNGNVPETMLEFVLKSGYLRRTETIDDFKKNHILLSTDYKKRKKEFDYWNWRPKPNTFYGAHLIDSMFYIAHSYIYAHPKLLHEIEHANRYFLNFSHLHPLMKYYEEAAVIVASLIVEAGVRNDDPLLTKSTTENQIAKIAGAIVSHVQHSTDIVQHSTDISSSIEKLDGHIEKLRSISSKRSKARVPSASTIV